MRQTAQIVQIPHAGTGARRTVFSRGWLRLRRARPARVLIDATKLVDGVTDGIGRYARELLWHLGQVADDVRGEYTIDVTFDAARAIPLGDAMDAIARWPRVVVPSQSRMPETLTHAVTDRGIRRRLRSAATRMAGRGRRFWKPVERPLQGYHLLHLPLPNSAILYKLASPLLVTVHDLSHLVCPEFQTQENIRSLDDGLLLSLKRRAHFLAVSQATRDELLELLSVPPDCVTYVPEAADTDRFRAVADPEEIARLRRRYRLPDEPFVLALGTLEPRKNLSGVVRACRRVFDRRPDLRFHLVIAGRYGWGDQDVLRRAIGESDRVHRIGGVEDEDLPALYGLATAFCAMSFYEGFCLPVVEAMACGCPVIHSDRGAIAEVAGGAGIAASPADIDGIAARIERILSQPALLPRLRSLGVARAADFSWTNTARQTLELYAACVQRQPAVVRPGSESDRSAPGGLAPAGQAVAAGTCG